MLPLRIEKKTRNKLHARVDLGVLFLGVNYSRAQCEYIVCVCVCVCVRARALRRAGEGRAMLRTYALMLARVVSLRCLYVSQNSPREIHRCRAAACSVSQHGRRPRYTTRHRRRGWLELAQTNSFAWVGTEEDSDFLGAQALTMTTHTHTHTHTQRIALTYIHHLTSTTK